MAREYEKPKRSPAVSRSPFLPGSVLEKPLHSSTSSANKHPKSTPKLVDTARTSNNTSSVRRLVDDRCRMTASPTENPLAAKSTESPSYRASQKSKMQRRAVVQGIQASQTQTQAQGPMKDLSDLYEIMDDNMPTQSNSSSSHATALAIAALDRLPGLKHRRSSSLSSSSSSLSDDSSDSESSSGSSTAPSPKRMKHLSHPVHKSIANPSTVASRNPLPPKFIKRKSTIYQSSTLHRPQLLPHRPHANTDNKNLKTVPVTATSLTTPSYPTSVLNAARALESTLPPYLHTTTYTQADITKLDANNIHKPLRPQIDSDDTSRLVMLLESARKLIVHLSTKKVSEGSKALMLQAELLRIAQQREATIKVLWAEVRRWRIVAARLELK
ncbi:hypothetical protein DV736_g3766, partial [Chaetothyriales sp. CBS 134916]